MKIKLKSKMTFSSLIFDIKNIITLDIINYYKLLESENKELKQQLDDKEENLEYIQILNQEIIEDLNEVIREKEYIIDQLKDKIYDLE